MGERSRRAAAARPGPAGAGHRRPSPRRARAGETGGSGAEAEEEDGDEEEGDEEEGNGSAGGRAKDREEIGLYRGGFTSTSVAASRARFSPVMRTGSHSRVTLAPIAS